MSPGLPLRTLTSAIPGLGSLGPHYALALRASLVSYAGGSAPGSPLAERFKDGLSAALRRSAAGSSGAQAGRVHGPRGPQAGRVHGPQSGLGCAEVPLAPADPSRFISQARSETACPPLRGDLRPGAAGAAGVFRGKMVTLARWGRAGSILAGRKAFPAPEWRNWQTRKIQVLVQVTGWRFKSSLGHSAAASLPLRGTLPLRRRCVATEEYCGTATQRCCSGAAGVFGRRSVGTQALFCGGCGFSTRFSAASGSQQRWQHGRVDPLGLRGRIVPGP